MFICSFLFVYLFVCLFAFYFCDTHCNIFPYLHVKEEHLKWVANWCNKLLSRCQFVMRWFFVKTPEREQTDWHESPEPLLSVCFWNTTFTSYSQNIISTLQTCESRTLLLTILFGPEHGFHWVGEFRAVCCCRLQKGKFQWFKTRNLLLPASKDNKTKYFCPSMCARVHFSAYCPKIFIETLIRFWSNFK